MDVHRQFSGASEAYSRDDDTQVIPTSGVLGLCSRVYSQYHYEYGQRSDDCAKDNSPGAIVVRRW